jgi:hypothetical protein
MALTAGQIIALACESAHSPRKTAQAFQFYNSILSDLCQSRDFAEARGQFMFNFTLGAGVPSVPVSGGGGVSPGGGGGVSPGGGGGISPGGGTSLSVSAGVSSSGVLGTDALGNFVLGGSQPSPIPPSPIPPGPSRPVAGIPPNPETQFGSGPILLPVDYLRLSGSSGSSGSQRSFIWWLDGVPYPVIPMDLAEFDMQVQQGGLQSFVWLSATDMAAPIDDRILLKTTADVMAGSTALTNLGSITRLVGGGVLGVAGQGIVPGTTLITVTSESGGGGGISPGGGGGVSPGGGGGISPGGGGGSTGATAILSQPANATIAGASIFFGYPPIVYVYPPPESALQAMIRYQKQMPDVVDPSRIPWYRNDEYMIEKLVGMLCLLNDDTRADRLLGGPDVVGSPEQKLTNWLAMKDDEQSHPKRVELDRRYFGRGLGRLRDTKRVGW